MVESARCLTVPAREHYDPAKGTRSRTGIVKGEKVAMVALRILHMADDPNHKKGARRPDKTLKRAWFSHAGASISYINTGVSLRDRNRMAKVAEMKGEQAYEVPELMSDRSSRRCVHWLARLGAIRIHLCPGHPHIYEIIPDKWRELADRAQHRGRGMVSAGAAEFTSKLEAFEVEPATPHIPEPSPEDAVSAVRAMLGDTWTTFGSPRGFRKLFAELYDRDLEKWRIDWGMIASATAANDGAGCVAVNGTANDRGQINWTAPSQLGKRVHAAHSHAERTCGCSYSAWGPPSP